MPRGEFKIPALDIAHSNYSLARAVSCDFAIKPKPSTAQALRLSRRQAIEQSGDDRGRQVDGGEFPAGPLEMQTDAASRLSGAQPDLELDRLDEPNSLQHIDDVRIVEVSQGWHPGEFQPCTVIPHRAVP